MLVETKLLAPAVREQLIERPHLLERLDAGASLRLTLIACPAGFGKTSLLGEWFAERAAQAPMAWLTIDKGDNDSAVLWAHLVEALRRVCPQLADTDDAAVFSSPPVVELLLPRLVNALTTQPPVTLIIDDFHQLTDGRSRESIHWLLEHSPPSFQLVLATRVEPDLPLATWRAHGDLAELRADDLRFDAEEADRFLNGRQLLGLSDADVVQLVERTDGWPAGLYLAALSLRRASDRHDLVMRFGASNRHVTDFLENEVLQAHDPEDQDLMLRASILGTFSGELADAVLEQSGAGEALRQISRSNLFLVALDERGGWYRFHPLFAQLLRVELERRHPGESQDLHRRAYEWHLQYGKTGEAIHHAVAAGMDEAAAGLVAQTWFEHLNLGHFDSVLAWIDEIPQAVVDTDVRLVLAKAWAQSLSGRQAEAETTIEQARLLAGDGEPLPDGFTSAEASLETLQGVFPWGDVGSSYRHATRALELEGPESPWHAVAAWAVALGHLSRGEYAEADALFREAITHATPRHQWLVICTALSYRSIIAGEMGHRKLQAQFADGAVSLAREYGLEDSSAGPWMARGASLIAQKRPVEALPVMERAARLARVQGQPLLLVRVLRYLGDALTLLDQHEGAAAIGTEARSVLATCIDPGALDEKASAKAVAGESGTVFGEPLTHRELTILQLLSGHLSQAQIGRELFVSHSTVHSHVKSIYRKLGVSSRAEALDRAHAAGYI